MAWALLSGLAGEIHVEHFPQDLLRRKSRVITPGAFFLESCDGTFMGDDLNEEGNAFAQAYFDFDTGSFLADYAATLGGGLPDSY
ncbi:MAG TPA: hypothetical protein VKU02_10115 [Gemmataceae bacterium]|nr:hypothetical protein [Gemmataceae bacterium]